MRRLFLGTTALMGFSLAAPAAFAACSTTNPVNNEVVNCTGTSTNQITGAGSTGVTVNVQSGAQLNTNIAIAVTLGANGSVNLIGNGSISTTGGNSTDVFLNGNNGSLTMNAGSSISTTGAGSDGAFLQGTNAQVNLTGASITTQQNNAFGLRTAGSGATLMLNSSQITTAGLDAGGIYVNGSGSVVTLNGNTQITTTGSGAFAKGIILRGNTSTLTLNGTSTIHSVSYGLELGTLTTATINAGAGIFQSGGSAGAVQLNGATLINHGTISNNFAGIAAVEGANGTDDIVVNDGSIVGLAGPAIDLRSGNDRLTLDTGSFINGAVDGGAGVDTLTLQGTATDANTFQNFEHLVMNGSLWNLQGNSSFITDIAINSGRLDINGTVTAPITTVGNSGELGGAGTLIGDVNSTGIIAPGNPGDITTSTLHITGNLVQTGGGFIFKFDNAGFDQVNATGTITLNNAPSVTFAPIAGATGATGVILHAGGGITGSLGAVGFVGNGAATLTQTANDISVNGQSLSIQSVDGSAFAANAFAASETGLDMIDTIGTEQLAGLDDCGQDKCALPGPDRRHVWAKGLGRFGKEGSQDGNQGFDYRIAGGGMGADFRVADGLRLGIAGLYGNTDETVDQDAADSDINTALAALYANYQHDRFFVTGAVTGGWQSFDLARSVLNSSQGLDGRGNPITVTTKDEVDGSTSGWLVGANLQAGMRFRFPNNWHLTPSIGASYQHQWINGYREHGTGSVSVASEQADALRLKAQLELAQDYQANDAVITPHLRLGVRQQYNFGGAANGAFSDGTDFSLDLKNDDRTVGLAGVGVQVAFNNGLATYVDYDGTLVSGRTVHAVTGGLRYSW